MTIPEQLQISVLAAPLASVDRRALSQAWYSALYGQQKRSHCGIKSRSILPLLRPRAAARLRSHASVKGIVAQPRGAAAVKDSELRRPSLGAVHERRSAPAKTPCRMQKAAGVHEKQTQSATFSLGKRGRVHVVVQQSGSRVCLIALCGRGMAAAVSQAIEEARYALASRGIRLESRTL